MFEEQALDGALHDRASFRCGIPELDEYLHRYAWQQVRKGITALHVLVDPASPKTILGYYALSAAQVDTAQLPEHERKHLPRYPIPCFRMGRLACRSDRRGQGLGRLLLGCAVQRCLLARQHVAAYALLVDAKDETSAAFCRHHGFIACRDTTLTLYLPLGG